MSVAASTFGVRLRALRRAAGLTMEQLAEASGVSARAISDMERGHSRAPQARTLAALADGLRASDADRAALLAAAKQARSTSAAGRPRLCEPPRGVTDFVGRAAELAIARNIARNTARDTARDTGRDTGRKSGGGPTPVLVVHGQAGLGKTAFAVRVAEDLRDDFPDGPLYLDLRGVDPAPLPVAEALHRLLRALDVRPGAIADSDDERSAQLRAILRDRRCLLVLDNAGSEAQVRPLLPADGGCLVVVTSRRALGGLEGVVRVALPTLTPAESAHLLGAIAARAADPAAAGQVDAVSTLCGHLPLALRIAGTRLASRPQWTVASMVDRLADAERRLAALSAGDTGVAAAFGLSYAHLSGPAAVAFRRLAHVPGGDFAAPLAAVLTETPLAEAEDRLDELVEHGLLQPEGADRYRFHDLIRLYAADRLRAEETPGERAAAERRMTTWLLETAIVAARWYEPDHGALPDGWAGLVPLATLDEAGAWLRAETDNWFAALRTAAAAGRHQLVVDLSGAIYWYSSTRGDWSGWPEVYGLGSAAAAALPDRRQQAKHLSRHAWAVLHVLNRPDEGADLAMEAFRLAEAIGDLGEQARALDIAEHAWGAQRRFDKAEWANRTVRDLALRTGDYDTYVAAVNGLGHLLDFQGRYDEAVEEHRTALSELDRYPLSPQMAVHVGAHAWYGIAAAHVHAGRWSEALLAAERALPPVLDSGSPYPHAYLLVARGRAHARLGHVAEARADLTRGLEMIDALDAATDPPNRHRELAVRTLAELDEASTNVVETAAQSARRQVDEVLDDPSRG